MWLVEKMPLQSFRCSLLQSWVCQILLISSRILLGFFFLCLKAKALSKIFLWIGDVFACTWWGSVVHMILKPAPSGGCSTMNGFRWEGWIPATCRVSQTLCVVSFPRPALQVFLPSSHTSPGVWWLREVGDRVQHLQGRGSSPQLFHDSLTAGVDHHGDGEIPSSERILKILQRVEHPL